jgi:EAL domain-containing protein (putative c-di-GMP-specific phosphodiesterase class I)
LRQQNFLDSLGDIISESGLPSHLLQLEFTENIFYQNLEEITQEIAVIKDMGVTWALDDFGVGNSTLNSLTRIPFDVIKIDRSLVHDIGEDARKTAIVLGVLQMAHSLSLQVVAEGIENINQLAFFHKHGCRLMQGWYFSPALPVEQAENLLRGKAHYPFPRPAQIPVNPKREV